ncbi:MAG TPA: bifunctional nicotinamidase/pyrazinamidase [Termitinemataceae bacterium]|nr:bifunctional nicotinamidase/pyrazinamidase [Termitinemataceae bacterium]HOM22846.1 bifunctional nicotinamidase/pyrazinamidase [Termitinemataceae bacterium]HPP99787.1 bifunctional nicotinamidase/pyrazinamidase [Termitinemataceae bacterium]
MKALIVVDVQNDFIPGGALPVPAGNEVVPLINRLMPLFPLVVATQDWHPAGHVSFASSHRGKRPYEVIDLAGNQQVLWPDHCVQGSAGADFAPALETFRFAAIIRKGTDPLIDSYSGFYDNRRQRSTGLAGYLREQGVTEVYLCGLASEYCVFYTALDAQEAGFSTYYIEDATRPIQQEAFEAAKKTMQKRGIRLIQSDTIF